MFVLSLPLPDFDFCFLYFLIFFSFCIHKPFVKKKPISFHPVQFCGYILFFLFAVVDSDVTELHVLIGCCWLCSAPESSLPPSCLI